MSNLRHGDARAGNIAKLHKTWRSMLARCNPNHARPNPDYAGRGIRVCEAWRSYEVFKAWALANGYAPDLTIDRMDNAGHYEPANCRWASRSEQARNRRSSRMITIDGRSMPAAAWLDETGVTQSAFYGRLARGWPVRRALELHP